MKPHTVWVGGTPKWPTDYYPPPPRAVAKEVQALRRNYAPNRRGNGVTAAAVIAALAKSPGSTYTQIAAVCDFPYARTRKTMMKLAAFHVIKQDPISKLWSKEESCK